MDWLTFFANIIDSLAWPATSLIVLFFLVWKGNEIANIFKSIKYKDFEVTFKDDFSKAKELVDTLESGDFLSESADSMLTFEADETLKLAEKDRSLAVLKIWQGLETGIVQLIQHNGLVRFTNPSAFMHKLHKLGKINKQDIELYDNLRKIRNDVVHLSPYGHEVKMTLAEVVEYKRFVDALLARLESIRQEDGYINVD